MRDALTEALNFHALAEEMQVAARMEANQQKRKILAAIAELYYLLHDKYAELDGAIP
jgi:hypothetical protein